ncbi:hypothetical protein [Streptomyces fragilis]|uniref:hypothetical protein n=1 Tax=Streptomyces fragilis TaxID=67301 RepID=UPI0024DE930E|nr:hypothetical protein [Streptomyces fragilis]
MTTDHLPRYDRAMVRLMNRGEGRTLYASARRRRVVVAAHVALTAALGGLMTYLYLAQREQWWLLVPMVPLLLAWMFLTGVINSATRGLLELRERALDERQLTDRARVGALAHRAMTLLLLAAVAVLLCAGAVLGAAPTAYAAPLLIAVLVTHWLMPLWVAGTTARDEPEDDLPHV